MARGVAGIERPHTVSVRISPEEREAWAAVRDASPRREMGAWVRGVVNEQVAGHGPGEEAGAVAEELAGLRRQLVKVGTNLNQAAHVLNAAGVDPERVERLESVSRQVAAAVAEVTTALRVRR